MILEHALSAQAHLIYTTQLSITLPRLMLILQSRAPVIGLRRRLPRSVFVVHIRILSIVGPRCLRAIHLALAGEWPPRQAGGQYVDVDGIAEGQRDAVPRQIVNTGRTHQVEESLSQPTKTATLRGGPGCLAAWLPRLCQAFQLSKLRHAASRCTMSSSPLCWSSPPPKRAPARSGQWATHGKLLQEKSPKPG